MKVMIGHQREVLAQLGIDVWIPRDVMCQKMDRASFWRDQSVSEIITELEPVIETAVIEQKTVVEESIVEKSIQQKVPVIETLPEVLLEAQQQLEIADFSLQALVLPRIVIILDSSVISAEQQQLWANIQRAIQAEFFELNWPFAMAGMNDGYGVGQYIQGFIDAIATEKTIICLGSIPHWMHSTAIYIESLQEMLETPILKRRLWNFIQNKPSN